MGQKVNPNGIRLGYIRNWSSTWYSSSSDYANKLNEDIKIRKFLYKKLATASISKIQIERPAKNAKITIYSARPGIIIGKKGEEIEKLSLEINKIMGIPVQINIEEIRKPEIDAKLVADNIAQQLEKRVMFRRVMKKIMQSAIKSGAKGIKIMVSGRLSGSEIARSEWLKNGRIPLQTFRANIDYATSQALTTYGVIGIKVWIYKGEIIKEDNIQNKNKGV